ncbi:hypothetical protein P154DRAFT_74603 [Amniculicola lignicola CBS 123094]|uniref:Uncharacterized protein n=1 Tax=Amniculicola lignicola CBS 123094 TaxID=1392246 RepID=A0A6A5VXJ2_9PLEO|nr:hypothetical protein P154DRAFT_74603 [Amniculicola lignicola CBS 123094]
MRDSNFPTPPVAIAVYHITSPPYRYIACMNLASLASLCCSAHIPGVATNSGSLIMTNCFFSFFFLILISIPTPFSSSPIVCDSLAGFLGDQHDVPAAYTVLNSEVTEAMVEVVRLEAVDAKVGVEEAIERGVGRAFVGVGGGRGVGGVISVVGGGRVAIVGVDWV